jgi:hypothetical protein
MNTSLNSSSTSHLAARFARRPDTRQAPARPLETHHAELPPMAEPFNGSAGMAPHTRKMNAHTQVVPPKASRGSPRPVAGDPAHKQRRLSGMPAFAHPVLTGDRERLRTLRAAEMADWEVARPAISAITPECAEGRPARRPSLVAHYSPGMGSLLFFLLAACASLALFPGFRSTSELLTGWSQFAAFIRFLLL